jgi:hypothetical protein
LDFTVTDISTCREGTRTRMCRTSTIHTGTDFTWW